MKKALSVKEMVLCALFASLIAAGAFIRIPLPAVPFSMQFFFTNLAGLLLGKKRGAMSVLLYIFIGLIGAPVFTQGGGPGYVLLPSFGYLPGMALGAWLSGLISERSDGMRAYLLAGLAGLFVTYSVGAAYYAMISIFYLSTEVEIRNLLIYCVAVFLPGDGLSALLGAYLAIRIRPVILRSGSAA